MGTRRRFTPEYRRDVASLVLDTGLRSRLWLGIEGWVNRWWAGGSHSSAGGARLCVRAALIHARWKLRSLPLRRRVPELEKENELVGKASAFFASGHHNTSALN